MSRQDLLNSIATTIQDYRAGDIEKPTAAHVDRWVKQFADGVQVALLREMDHVLKRTYFSLERVTAFLRELIGTEKLVGKDPCAFWRSVNFLEIQGGGNSQREMLALFSEVLKERCGFAVNECGGKGATLHMYLDDAILSGNRVRRDLETWIQMQAPVDTKLHVVSIALHSGGWHYANGYISKAAVSAKKKIEVMPWRAIELEDRKIHTDAADVLKPTTIPEDEAVHAYIEAMKHKPILRKPGNVGAKGLYSGDEGKILLEQEFLKAGAKIRRICPNLGDTQRPLGHMTLDTLGFGSMIVTFRNCPNNAPLALWVGDPWNPLFPRTTNSQTAIKRLFEDLTKDGA